MMRVTGPESAPVRRSSSGSGLRVRVLAGPAPELASGIGMAEIAVPPGSAMPAHSHGEAETLVYVVSGRAGLASGGRDEEVAAGEAAHLPRGTEVAVSNRGDETLRLLTVFSPAGFERGFLGWPAEGAEALVGS
jgi:quercetin dioxygenase-like cupin family protein